jgi:hypothetical protein
MSDISAEKDHWLVENLWSVKGEKTQNWRGREGRGGAKNSKNPHLILGTRILLTPPSLTLIFKQRLERVWGEVRLTFLAWTHWVAMPSTVSPTRFTSAGKEKAVSKRPSGRDKHQETPTIDRGLSRKHHHHQLQALECRFEVAEHGLHLVGALSIFTETRLSNDRHASIVTDALELLSEISETKKAPVSLPKISKCEEGFEIQKITVRHLPGTSSAERNRQSPRHALPHQCETACRACPTLPDLVLLAAKKGQKS